VKGRHTGRIALTETESPAPARAATETARCHMTAAST